jgi:2-polyprenyl-6-methoxyphenol hydroxylase-like FAD-dependent oxidoreductase
MRIGRRPDDVKRTLGRFRDGRILVMIERGDYWQCAYVLRKGGIDELKAAGLEAFQDAVRDVAPFLGERVREIDSWDKVKLLTVAVDRLGTWHRDGLLCIGDSAHAMSPIGGVGVNLAVQDAVAAANVLAPALARGAPGARDRARIQRRRLWPTRVTQRAQVLIQDKILSRALGVRGPARLPWQMRLLRRFPYLRRFPARFVGMGARIEHVRTRAA